jgi:2-oxoglutarate ferredoxin oxidoreductase subunit alpha
MGGCDLAVSEAVAALETSGVYVDYMRIRGFPFHHSVEEFLYAHDLCFIVEQNRDAQLRSLLTLETCVPKNRLRSILAYGGFPLSARDVVDRIMTQLEADRAFHS